VIVANPLITSVAPGHGPLVGGTRIDIHGQGFAPGCNVKVGDIDALDIAFVDSTEIQANTPACSTPGLVDVKVKNPGVPAATLSGAFQYDPLPMPTINTIIPNHGPIAGNTQVDIRGANFDPQANIKFGDIDGLNIQVIDSTEIKVT